MTSPVSSLSVQQERANTGASEPPENHWDVVIVGAGIIGLAHAYVALKAGKSVVVIERDAEANGASIRNFGHACFTAQPEALRPLAFSSREGWLQASADAGFDVATCGTLVVARTQVEMELLKELAEARPDHVKVLNRTKVNDQLGGLAPDVLGGAMFPLDARVDPRSVVHQLAAWVLDQPHGDVVFNTSVRNVQGAQTSGATAKDSSGQPRVTVTTTGDTYTADRAIICIGHDLPHLYPNEAREHDVLPCTLNMTRVRLPQRVSIPPAILTSTSMGRYGAFAEVEAIGDLRIQLQTHSPGLISVVANVMATQAPDGTMMIGDTHTYGHVAVPFMNEEATNLVLEEMRNTLGVESFEVLERWQGVYADSPNQDVLRLEPEPGVEVVTVTGGVGMTLSFGIAKETFGS